MALETAISIKAGEMCIELLVFVKGEVFISNLTFFEGKFLLTSDSTYNCTIVHGGQKIESAQKIHTSRGRCNLHVNQFRWVWPFWFRRFCSAFLSSKMTRISLWTMDLIYCVDTSTPAYI